MLTITYDPYDGIVVPDFLLKEKLVNLINEGIDFSVGTSMAFSVIRLLVKQGVEVDIKFNNIKFKYQDIKTDIDYNFILNEQCSIIPETKWPFGFSHIEFDFFPHLYL